MNSSNIKNILKAITWDYNITAEDIMLCLQGGKKYAGFYNRLGLITKIFEHLAWFDIIKIFTWEEIIEFLTVENIKKIYPKGLQDKYERLRRLLSGEVVSAAGWSSENNARPEYPVLSNRWHRT